VTTSSLRMILSMLKNSQILDGLWKLIFFFEYTILLNCLKWKGIFLPDQTCNRRSFHGSNMNKYMFWTRLNRSSYSTSDGRGGEREKTIDKREDIVSTKTTARGNFVRKLWKQQEIWTVILIQAQKTLM
jgi:hypothetical protein